MGKHFTIDADFWTNAAVADSFSAEEKFLYLFLCTSKHLSMCGCCEISTRTIAIETGLEGYMVERALSRLQKEHGVVCRDEETRELFLVNWIMNNWNRSPKWRKRVTRDISEIKSQRLRRVANAQLLKAQEESEQAERAGLRPGFRTNFRP